MTKAIAVAIAAVASLALWLLKRWWSRKAEEHKKAEKNYEKVEAQIDNDDNAADVQSGFDDLNSGL